MPSPVRHTGVARLFKTAFPYSTSGIHGWDHQAAQSPGAAASYSIKADSRVAGPWVSDPPPVGRHSSRSSVLGTRRTQAGSPSSRPRSSGGDLGSAVIRGVTDGVPTRTMIEAHPQLVFRISSIDAARRLYPQPHDASRPFQVIWIYGPSGTGKTTYISALFAGKIFRATSTTPFLQAYVDQEIIVFDDAHESTLLAHTEDIIRICDPTTTHHNIKYGLAVLRHNVVVFTSNFLPIDVFSRERLAPMHRRIHLILYMPSLNVVIPQRWDLANFSFVDILTPIPPPKHPLAP